MGMKRTILKSLEHWKNSPNRKPLVLMGARQTGKTYILKAFSEAFYENCVYLNFEDEPGLKNLFEPALTPERLLSVFSIAAQQTITPGKTLIFLDEIQECPNALISLKYFNEKANEYHLCVAGSLLGVKLSNTKGFPVGKVNFLTLYPMSFMEFLEALNEKTLKEYLSSLKNIEPLPEILHEKLIRYLKDYFYIGGMPEVVSQWIKTHNYTIVRETQQAILKAYTLDFSKHAPPEIIMKIHQVWQTIPSQLAKENKKFIYSVIRKGARAKDFELAIQWLMEAGLLYKVYNITFPNIPLTAYVDRECFKTYLLDVGLLGAMTGLSPQILIQGHEYFTEFRGSFVENFIAQSLMCSEVHDDGNLYYWSSEGKAEVDFIFSLNNQIYPLEIKSGNTNKKKSLRVYDDKYSPPLLIRSSPMNLKKDGKILNCPLYLLENIKMFLVT